MGKGSKLCLKAGVPPLLRVNSWKTGCFQPCLESRVEEKYRELQKEGVLMFSWPKGELIPQITCLRQRPSL